MKKVDKEEGGKRFDCTGPKPGEKKPSPKISYAKQVKFGDDAFLTGCVTYDPAVIAKIKT